MNGCRADAALAMAAIEFDREENPRRLRAAIGNPLVILGLLEIWVSQVDIRIDMCPGGQDDDSATAPNQRSDPVDEYEGRCCINRDERSPLPN